MFPSLLSLNWVGLNLCCKGIDFSRDNALYFSPAAVTLLTLGYTEVCDCFSYLVWGTSYNCFSVKALDFGALVVSHVCLPRFRESVA